MLRKLKAILLLLFISTFCHAQYEHLVNQPYSTIITELGESFFAYPFWNIDSVTAFQKISALKITAERLGDTRLEKEAGMSRIQYRIHNKLCTYKNGIDSFLALEKDIRQQDIYQKDILQLRLKYLVSLQYYYHEAFGKALEHQMKYYRSLDTISAEEYPLKKNYVSHIGVLYYAFNDYKLAQKYLQQAAGLPTEYPHVNIDIYNTLGLIMRNRQVYDSALHYFDTALAIAVKNNETTWQPSLKGNIGIILYHQKEYDKAIPLLKEDINMNIQLNAIENITNSIIKLADIYRIKKQYDSAEHYIKLGRYYAEFAWGKYQHFCTIYKLSGKLARQRGDFKLAYRYSDSANMAKDSLQIRKRAILLASVQRAVDEEKRKTEVEKIDLENKLNIRKRNNIIIILSLSTIIILLILNRVHLKRKRLYIEKEKAAAKLSLAQQELNNYTKILHEKNALLQNSTEEIEKLNARLHRIDHDAVGKLQQATILTDEDWEHFRQLFEQVHSGYIYRLRQQIPDLTPAETRLIVLTKLRFTYKEMSAMLGVSQGTLRSSKSRLIKKLQLDEEVDFETFVDNV